MSKIAAKLTKNVYNPGFGERIRAWWKNEEPIDAKFPKTFSGYLYIKIQEIHEHYKNESRGRLSKNQRANLEIRRTEELTPIRNMLSGLESKDPEIRNRAVIEAQRIIQERLYSEKAKQAENLRNIEKAKRERDRTAFARRYAKQHAKIGRVEGYLAALPAIENKES